MSKIFSDKPSTDEFNSCYTKAVAHSAIECEFCGRVHYADESNGGLFEGNQYAELERMNKETPQQVIKHDHSVAYGVLENKVFIPTCPCNVGYNYEQFMMNNREQIAAYFTKMKGLAEQRANEFGEVANAAKSE